MSYIYDGRLLHRYVCAASGVEAGDLPDIYVGIGKVVNGRIAAAFTLRGFSGRAYEFSGAATSPSALKVRDYIVMVQYIIGQLKPDAVLAFTDYDNDRAKVFLGKIGFDLCGSVKNYRGNGKDCLLYELNIEKLQNFANNALQTRASLRAKVHNTGL